MRSLRDDWPWTMELRTTTRMEPTNKMSWMEVEAPPVPEVKETGLTSEKEAKTPNLVIYNSMSTTSLEEIYAIPLDKDPLQFNPSIDASCATSWFPGKTPYAFLTHSFILINSTRSRLKIVDYLVNTLRVVTHHDPESLLPLVWLTTNAIAPPFEGVELNLGGSVISKALVSVSGLTPGALRVCMISMAILGMSRLRRRCLLGL